MEPEVRIEVKSEVNVETEKKQVEPQEGERREGEARKALSYSPGASPGAPLGESCQEIE